jgi:ubiquinone/menaquinone biosynthesis C-methylase UbiE
MKGVAPDQTDLFTTSEGDAWYRRNKAQLESRPRAHEIDAVIEVLNPFKGEINSVLEIGCGNGAKLEQLAEFFSAQAEGIEPSALAVSEGNERLQRSTSPARLIVGTADKLPYADAHFDLVYLGFCLYLVDRRRLFASIAEADRVLRPGGFLSIFDFDPSVRHKRAYRHRSGIFSYKTQYDRLFTASGHYHLVSKSSFTPGVIKAFSKDSNERVALTVLYKETDLYPVLEQAE